MLLYTAGPYSADTDAGIQNNINTASQIAAELWEIGHAVICPQANSAMFQKLAPNMKHSDWLKGDKQMIAVCDGIVFLPGYEHSKGSMEELDFARSVGFNDDPNNGKPVTIWYYPDVPSLHGTEVKSPEQVKAFREEVGRMMRTFLSTAEAL